MKKFRYPFGSAITKVYVSEALWRGSIITPDGFTADVEARSAIGLDHKAGQAWTKWHKQARPVEAAT